MKQVKWLAIILITASLLIGTAVVFANAGKTTEIPVQAPTSVPLNADTIFALVNNERAQRGLQPLIRDARLDASAQAKADDMNANNYFDHVRNGKHGYEYIPIELCSYRSENIGMTSGYLDDNPQQLEWWMASKPHHDAILRADYTLTGVAVSGNKVVQHFCIAK